MSPNDLIVRCMARRESGVFVAVCLDFSLAAQGSTLDEARGRLHDQITGYVRDACTIDREHAAELLTRKAPLHHRLLFRICKLHAQIKPALERFVYSEALPLCPAF